MNKKEKIIALCFTTSMFLLIGSSIFTIYQNKPENTEFLIEKYCKKIAFSVNSIIAPKK